MDRCDGWEGHQGEIGLSLPGGPRTTFLVLVFSPELNLQFSSSRLAPAVEGNCRPHQFHCAKRPSTLQESVNRTQHARSGECQDESRRPILVGIADHHRDHREQAEYRQRSEDGGCTKHDRRTNRPADQRADRRTDPRTNDTQANDAQQGQCVISRRFASEPC